MMHVPESKRANRDMCKCENLFKTKLSMSLATVKFWVTPTLEEVRMGITFIIANQILKSYK